MMKYKGTLILLSLVAVLGLYLYFVELPGQKAKQQEEERSKKVVTFEPHEAVSLYLSYPRRASDPEILLEKDQENRWQIVKPLAVPADPFEVEGLLSSIGSIRIERVVEEKAQDLKVYGLDKPEIKVSVRLKDHDVHLLLGNEAPIGSTLYVMRDGEDTVRLTDQFYKTRLAKTVTELRKKEVLDLDPEQVNGLTFQYSGQNFALAKENDQWWIRKPRLYRADDETVSDLLGSLARLKAKDFVDEGQPALLKTFRDPRLKVELSGGARPFAVSIYESGSRSQERKTYAVTDPQSPIYLVEAAEIAGYEKDLFALRDKHLLSFDPAQVQGVEIHKGSEEPLTVHRQGESWSFDGVTGLLKNLSALEAEKMVEETPRSPNPYGLSPPRYRIVLLNAQKSPLAELLIGSEKDNLVYSRSGSSEEIFLIKDQIISDLPQKEDLRK